jgi:hypothetical protein
LGGKGKMEVSGKGSKQRPAQVPSKEFELRWELAFGKKDKAEQDLKEHLKTTKPHRNS